jgi:hypothetical protein
MTRDLTFITGAGRRDRSPVTCWFVGFERKICALAPPGCACGSTARHRSRLSYGQQAVAVDRAGLHPARFAEPELLQDPSRSAGTPSGGWAFRYGPEAVAGDKFKLGSRLDTGALLLGRPTWQLFARIWLGGSDEFPTKMNKPPNGWRPGRSPTSARGTTPG